MIIVGYFRKPLFFSIGFQPFTQYHNNEVDKHTFLGKAWYITLQPRSKVNCCDHVDTKRSHDDISSHVPEKKLTTLMRMENLPGSYPVRKTDNFLYGKSPCFPRVNPKYKNGPFSSSQTVSLPEGMSVFFFFVYRGSIGLAMS